MKILLCVVCTACISWNSYSQKALNTSLFNVAIRHASLEEALAEFSALSGKGITYDPRLVEGHAAYCVIENAIEEDVLSCILDDSNLTYARLSSGTYVIMKPGQMPPQKGYLTGVVKDELTGRPLPEAHVLLASNTLDMGTVTNARGQFTLPSLLPGKYLLHTSYLGYQDRVDTLEVLPGHQSFQRVELKAKPIAITPVVIDGLQQKRTSEGLDRSILFNRNFREGGVFSDNESVMQQFKAVPGLRVNDITADAHLQGSNSDEHQFRLDGVPVFLPQSAIGIIGPFSPFAIQSLAIHKSGYGVEQGSHLAGVIEGSHFVESGSTLDAQLDLTAFNARLNLSKKVDDSRNMSFMAATRFSLWSLYQQEPFQNMLNTWSKPDPFLIFAPTQQYASIDPSFFQETLNVNSIPSTDLSFSDIHLAGQVETSPFSALNASFYAGQNRFGGSLLPDIISVNASILDFEENLPPMPEFEIRNVPVELSLIDEYSWRNVAGQLQYHTVLGRHTLFNIQGRSSTYRLNQNYLLVDSLDQFIADFPDSDTNPVANTTLDFPTSEINDSNSIEEIGMESQLDHAMGDHTLSLGLESTRSRGQFDLLLTSLPNLETETSAESGEIANDKERVYYRSVTSRHAMFFQDRISLNHGIIMETGVRLTYLPVRQTVYAEPRFALRFDTPFWGNGTLAMQLAGGLYRQYLLQFDVSTLNAGALFPSKRIWILIDENIRPPLAYHLSQSFLYIPSPTWTFQIDGYLKFQQRLWFLSYIQREEEIDNFSIAKSTRIDDPLDILSRGRGVTTGISLSAQWKPDPLQIDLLYDWSSVRRRSADLFDNTWFSAPWEEPHRLTAGIKWNIKSRLLLSMRFIGIWKRTWGFRQAYYDFFGHSSQTRSRNPSSYDFSTPDDHVLPPFYQIDLGMVYNQPVGTSNLQIRLELLNALNRKNVADWRLVWDGDTLVRDKRYHYPAIPSIAVRYSW